MGVKKNSAKVAVGERLGLFMDFLNLDVEGLSLELGCSVSKVSGILSGDLLMDMETGVMLVEKYGLDLHWMSTGVGGLFHHHGPLVSEHEYVTGSMLDMSYPGVGGCIEMFKLMRNRNIEAIIFGKFLQARHVFKDEIEKFKRSQE